MESPTSSYDLLLTNDQLLPTYYLLLTTYYEQLLPFLNKTPLRANLPTEAGPGSSWLAPSGDGDRCGHQAVTTALTLTPTPNPNSNP